MLQDLSFGRLENEFRDPVPADGDIVVCFQKDGILLCRNGDDSLELPRWAAVKQWSETWKHWNEKPLQYIFRLQGVNFFLWMGDAGECPEESFHYEPARQLRQLTSKDVCFAVMTAWHLYNWYKNNRFCGCCGSQTVHDDKERMMRCAACGNMIFPRISPAVIVAVTDGDRLLMSKYAGRSYARYALIAGYTEIGETLEQTVQREVMEEVGLHVKNIRYYKSQPWGVDGNVLMGFFCDLDGDDTIHLDETELSLAQWHDRRALPAHDDGISLTREMVRVFEEGREPKSVPSEPMLSKFTKEKGKTRRGLRAWEILLLVLGSPIWLSLLIAASAVVFSVYVALWSVIISLWAVFGALIGCALGGFAAGILFALNGNGFTGIALIGAGIVCAGLSILLFYGCKAATKGTLLLTKKIALGMKNRFIKREEA